MVELLTSKLTLPYGTDLLKNEERKREEKHKWYKQNISIKKYINKKHE